MEQIKIDGDQANEANEQQDNMDTEKPPPQIFNLIVDCFEKVFDYLSIKDLHSFGQTCTRMQHVVGHFYQQQLSETYFQHAGLREYVGLWKYVKNLRIQSNGSKSINVDWNVFESVKRISFHFVPNLDAVKKMPKKILEEMEYVELYNCEMTEPILESFVGLCMNVKYLKIHGKDVDDGWLTHKFPKLEHLRWYPRGDKKKVMGTKLQNFFEQNPSLHSFATFTDFLQVNPTALVGIKLDDFHICESWDQVDCDLLTTLHDNGVYNRLHIQFICPRQEHIDRLSSLKGLVGFSTFAFVEDVDLSALVNLKELRFGRNIKCVTDVPALARSLINLNEVRFQSWPYTMDDIMPFIRLSAKLTKIILYRGIPDDFKNLDAMNRERKKLRAETLYVSKVTIYISETSYLDIKWKTTEMDMELIEIRRLDSYNRSNIPTY